MAEFPSPVWIVVLLVALQRLAELAHAERNARRLRRKGAQEYGAGHYPLLVLLHGAWLVGLLFAVPGSRWPDIWLIGLFIALQPIRLWIILSLGPFWTTRVLLLPKHERIRSGPYRWFSHPNYMLVILEIAILPLAFGAWSYAAAFSLANFVILAHRVTIENRALKRHADATLCAGAQRKPAAGD